jgi:predicted dehydrogenase
MHQAYRAAMVGLGNIAWRFDRGQGAGQSSLSHAGAYERNSRTMLVGGCSPDAGDRIAFQTACRVPVYASLSDMLDHESPDIVSIASPSPWHFSQTMACLEKKIPMIWLEKPVAGSLQELDRLLETNRQGCSTVVVNFQRRYCTAYQNLRRVYQEQRLGTCELIQLNYSRGLEVNGAHILDMLFFVTDNQEQWHLEWASADGDRDNPCFSLVLANGPRVMVCGLSLPYHCIDMALTCEQGRVSMLHGGMTPVVEERVEHELFPGFHRLQHTGDDILGAGGLAGSMEAALDDLLDAFEQRREPVSNLKTARASLALIEEVHARQRRTGT